MKELLVVDSSTQLDAAARGAVVVCGSHGALYSAWLAARAGVRAIVFNDAGIGRDNAGIAALDMLQQRGIAAGTVAHTSARIGDARDCWENGVISRVNARARELGCAPGTQLRAALTALLSG